MTSPPAQHGPRTRTRNELDRAFSAGQISVLCHQTINPWRLTPDDQCYVAWEAGRAQAQQTPVPTTQYPRSEDWPQPLEAQP